MHKLEFLKNIIPSVGTHSSSVGTSFDIPRILPLVTTSMNLKSNHFFGVFKHIAATLHYSKDVWAIVLQCKLYGKAHKA